MNLNDADLHVEPYPYVKPGGQHVNDMRPGIRITHLPSGLVATSEVALTPIRNRTIALRMIEAGLNAFEEL